MKRNLNEKQKLFADLYIKYSNAEKAALEAGYSKTYARAQSYKLLEHIGIKTYIDNRMAEIRSEMIADQTEILQFLTSVMRGEVTEPITVLAGDGFQTVEEVKPSAQARKAAAELLGKRYAMWTDKTQITGAMAVNIVDDVEEDEDE